MLKAHRVVSHEGITACVLGHYIEVIPEDEFDENKDEYPDTPETYSPPPLSVLVYVRSESWSGDGERSYDEDQQHHSRNGESFTQDV